MEIVYLKKARKALLKMPNNDKAKVITKIEQLATFPKKLTNQVKKLQNSSFYRLRVGDYRVIFDENGHILSIIEIGSRGDIYKRGIK